MKITLSVEYSVRALCYLATVEKATVEQVEAKTGDPKNYLIKIFRQLQTAGLLISHKGFKGGFKLGRPASRITLADVYTAIEGEFRFQGGCLYTNEQCRLSEGDVACCRTVVKNAGEALKDRLASLTLADIIDTRITTM